jgi:hypothetical protein
MAVATRPAPRAAAEPVASRRFRTVDLLLLGYVAATTVIGLARLRVFPQCVWLLAANGLIVTLILLVTRPALGRVGRAVREIYPLVLLVPLYGALDILNGGGRVPVHDALVARWEAALFGGQPSRDWWQAVPSRFWSTMLHAAYFSYYLIVAVPPLVLAARRDLRGLRRFVLAVIATFIPCYLCFTLFPVAGPYYTFPRPSAEFLDNPMARLVYAALATGSSYGAAFPSSHVAVSVAATFAAWQSSRWMGVVVLTATALLTLSVVYCQMHYAVDAGGGVVVGAIVGAGLVLKQRER